MSRKPVTGRNKALEILVCDASADASRYLVRTVERSGVPSQCTIAGTGTDCLHALQAGRFDLAFIGLGISGPGGVEAIEQAGHHAGRTFFVVTGADADAGMLARARELGVHDYLPTPFRPERVGEILRTCLRMSKRCPLLLVDASAPTRAIIRRILKASRFNLAVSEAPDGETAIRRHCLARHDIIFLDLDMPGGDGFDILARLRAIHPEVPVVLIVGKDDAGRAAGETGFLLHKPFFAPDVDRVLHQAFGLRPPDFGGRPDDVAFI